LLLLFSILAAWGEI
jgi:hypothetical protein